MKAGAEYSSLLIAAASLVFTAACFTPDPQTVEGALAYAARAAEQRDTVRLFRILDQETRHALDATLKQRHEAARIIRETYPADEAEPALRELGDAVTAKSTEELFSKRCNSECIDWFSRNIAAPATQSTKGAVTTVRTIRDTTLTLHHGSDGWYGIVWRAEEMATERDRAARDLAQVQENARVYSARKRLESKP